MTLGTGGFFDCFTAEDKHASVKGIIPLMGWSVNGHKCYLAEGSNHYTSSAIAWAQQMGKKFKTTTTYFLRDRVLTHKNYNCSLFYYRLF